MLQHRKRSGMYLIFILFNTSFNVCTLQLCICAFSELTLLYLLQMCPNFNFFSRQCKQHPASNPNEPALVPCKLVLAKKTSPLEKNLVLISLKILDFLKTLNYFETIWLFRRESCLEGEGFVSRSDIKRHHCWHHRPHHHHHHAEHHRHQWWFTIIIIFQSFFTDTNITITIAHNIINITSATSSPSVSLPKSQT